MGKAHARCRLCSEKISFTSGNPVELGFHMIDRHSSGSVGQYSIHEDDHVCPSRKASVSKCTGECRKAGMGKNYSSPDERWHYTGKECDGKKRNRRKAKGLYKTTLETWSAGRCYMVCPTCKKEVKPLIRSQRNKVAYTSLGATFLLSCWPFCFLFPHYQCNVDLYCPQCKSQLGIYDTSTGAYNPCANVILKQPVPNICR